LFGNTNQNIQIQNSELKLQSTPGFSVRKSRLIQHIRYKHLK